MPTNPQALLRQHFPLLKDLKLKPFQERVIADVVENKSTVAIMPTGGGKSLIYWVAGMARGGITLVVSPLIALMGEQAAKLREQGCSVLLLHAGVSSTEQITRLTALGTGKESPDFIFLSPERIAIDGYLSHCLRCRAKNVSLVVIDEAHCISQWGFDFRPFYQRIPAFLTEVFESAWPPVLGLTATINPRELGDVITDLNIPEKNVLRDGELLRRDLKLHVEKITDKNAKEERLWQLLAKKPGEKALVYLYRKYKQHGAEDLAEKACQRGLKAAHFHGDMSADERQAALTNLRNGTTNVVFATNAFGMGIDISDIRTVIHFMLPESVEQYYQEVGRGGRDHQGADCWLLYSDSNVRVRRDFFIDKSYPAPDELASLFRRITTDAVGLKTLSPFFDDEVSDALPFFLAANLIQIVGKGFTPLNVVQAPPTSEVDKILKLTKTHSAISTLKKDSSLTPASLFAIFYEALRTGKATVIKTPTMAKCLLIQPQTAMLSDAQKAALEQHMAVKRAYKHGLLNQLLTVLESNTDSASLHAGVGNYLRVHPAAASPINRTRRGEWVRSKSEVIIANLLYENGIDYEYEAPLYYDGHKCLLPDFTLTIGGKQLYLEHVGMLDKLDYAQRWKQKEALYEQYFPGQLVTTEESAVLSQQAQALMSKLKTAT